MFNGLWFKVQGDGLDYLPNVPKKEGETWNELLYRLSQLFSLHGQNKDALAKTKLGVWEKIRGRFFDPFLNKGCLWFMTT